MKFDDLDEMIPYTKGGKQKVLSMHPYKGIKLRMPGRHAMETTPIGGDFVVEVTDVDSGLLWVDHQFKHDDIFIDLEKKVNSYFDAASLLGGCYFEIVHFGEDPDPMRVPGAHKFSHDSLDYVTFLHAVQCLAVAEHRRYAKFEAKLGGKYLPLRFAAGILDEKWTAAEAISRQKMGRPGVEWLEKEKGLPFLTEKLFEQVN